MKDLKRPAALWLKASLFLWLGSAASALLLAEAGSWQVALLLALAIWSFCRAYYFAFYVIEKYLDPGYRFSGLWSFVRYALARRRRG